MITGTLPSWAIGSAITKLKEVTEDLWQFLFDQLSSVITQGFISLVSEVGVELEWVELPFKPVIEPEDKRSFIQHYKDYMLTHGTRAGIMLIKEMFGLSYFEVIPLSGQYGYFFHSLKIRGNWSSEQRPRIEEMIRMLIPARCLFHYELEYSTGV